jgi:hypothetical protein
MAIRRCLERDPSLRYESAIEMAAALEGGLQGEEPGTAAFAVDSTQFLDDEDATQALPRTTALPRREQPMWDEAPRTVAPREERRPEKKKRSGAARARLFALALILLLAAVAIALLVSGGLDGGGVERIDAGNARDQAGELIDYIRAHRE